MWTERELLGVLGRSAEGKGGRSDASLSIHDEDLGVGGDWIRARRQERRDSLASVISRLASRTGTKGPGGAGSLAWNPSDADLRGEGRMRFGGGRSCRRLRRQRAAHSGRESRLGGDRPVYALRAR